MSRARLFCLLFLPFIAAVFAATPVAAQLNCETSGECFVECCPRGEPSCAQVCKTSCSSKPQSCPSYYFFCKFNTYAADFNFLELSNTSTQVLTGEVSFYDSGGKPIAGTQPFRLNGLARVDIDLHTVVGLKQYGQAVVSLNGEAQLLIAGVSQYKAAGFTQTVYLPCAVRARHGQLGD